METTLIIALAVAAPVILFPAAFIWYMNIGGIIRLVHEAKAKKVLAKHAA